MKPNYSLARFTAIVQKSNEKGGWTYVIWPESSSFFGTRARVKVRASAEGEVFQSVFMPLDDGTHMLRLKANFLDLIEKDIGDQVNISILERLDTGPACNIS